MSAAPSVRTSGARAAALLLAALTLLAAAVVGGVSTAAPASAAAGPTACDTKGGADYQGTSSSRDLTAAKIDPYKVADFPCSYASFVRGIRLNPTSVQLVAGGQLQRTIPISGDAQGRVTLQQIVTAIGDPAWATLNGGVVELKASLVQLAGTHLVVAAPAVTQVRLDDTPGGTIASIVGDAASADFTGVTITSWSPRSQGPVTHYATYRGTNYKGRSFIVYKNGGQLNFTNSTCRYLGSDTTSSYGVSWRLGTSGTVDRSTFEHNFFGVYTFETKNIVFKDGTYRDNAIYGMDPHTYSSHLTLTGNDVYGNGHHGIIFSRYVTDSVVEGNYSHDNAVNGIMMDFRSDGNVIRNNRVVDNGQGIVFSGSAKNDVHDNTITGNHVGVRASHDGADANDVHDNTITGGEIGVQLYGGASATTIAHNTITGSSTYGIVVDAPRSTIKDNTISGVKNGVRVETVATISGGSISARSTGIQADDESYATVRGTVVRQGEPVRTAKGAVVTLLGTTYQLPRAVGSISALDVAGVCVLLFALACELIHLSRRRGLRRVSAAYAGAGAGDGTGQRPAGAHRSSRLLLRAATPVAAAPASPAAATGATAGGQLVRETPTTPDERSRRFRPDIEGLRAIAVLAVLLSHAALGVRGGFVGVDVFFVISGFLITGQLLAEAEARGRFSFAGFYARRIRRILPAATVVTVVTLVAALLWAPSTRRGPIAGDGLAAALFGVNWRLAHQATDYFAMSDAVSPFQHYWSLSVEEQFYLLWPLLLAGVLLVARRRARRAAVAVVLAVVVAASLAASALQTSSNEPYAYFGTHTRAWELALGALVAVGARRFGRLTAPLARVIGWLGLAAVVLACLDFSSSTHYPGVAVALPVVGAAAIIGAGTSTDGAGRGVERLLGWAPLRWIGRISYSLYLWHWPLLVILPDVLGHPLTLTQRIIAVLVAVLLATVTYDLVEQPLRHRRSLVARPGRAFGLGAALVATSAVVALLVGAIGQLTAPQAVATTPQVSAALATSSGSVADQVSAAASLKTLPTDLTPSLQAAPDDFPDTGDCEVGEDATTPKLPCDSFGDTGSSTDVALIGDSHAGMWLSAVDAVAKQQHWRLTLMTKTGCPVGDYPDFDYNGKQYTACTAWRQNVVQRIRATHPALVIVGSEARQIAVDEPDGLTTTLRQISATGAKVAFLADTPSPKATGDVPDCLAAHSTDVSACALPRSGALDEPGRAAEVQAAQAAGATVIDPSAWFCTAALCPAVIADTVVYSDDSHITGTYGALRAPQLATGLEQALS